MSKGWSPSTDQFYFYSGIYELETFTKNHYNSETALVNCPLRALNSSTINISYNFFGKTNEEKILYLSIRISDSERHLLWLEQSHSQPPPPPHAPSAIPLMVISDMRCTLAAFCINSLFFSCSYHFIDKLGRWHLKSHGLTFNYVIFLIKMVKV